MTVTAQSPAMETRLSDVVHSVKDMFARRWLTFFIVTAVTLALAITLLMLAPSKYEASAQLRIDPSRNPLASVQPDSQASLSSEAMETEVSVLSSLDLAREVTRRYNLMNDPEFAKSLKDAGPMPESERLNLVAGALLKHLTVGREKLTYIISITFRSEDPVKAARIANGFAETYIQTRVGARRGAAEKQGEFFQRQLAQLEAAARQADAKVAQYRANAGLVKGAANGTIIDQQVAPLSTELATAESQAAEARSNLQAARNQVARGGIDAVASVRTSPVIGELRRQRADIIRQMSTVAARYGDKHPEMVKIRDQLGQIDEQIEAEARRAIGSLEAASQAADARAASLRGAMSGLERQQASDTRASVLAESLERDATNKREAYEKIAAMSLQSSQAANNSIGQAEVVTAAEPPSRPASPNRPLLGILALIVSASLGAAAIIVQEMMASGMRSLADLESTLGVTLLGSVPDTRKGPKDVRTQDAAGSIAQGTPSVYAESVRNVKASLVGLGGAEAPKVIAVTSSIPGEGKTVFSLSLARILAANGSSVVLVDCDLRRASIKDRIPGVGKADFVNVLKGEARLEDALVQDSVPTLHVLPVAKPNFNLEDPFSSAAMKDLLTRLRTRYQYVVLDLPPVMGIADTRAAAVQADAVAFLVRWGSTAPTLAQQALSLLKNDQAPVAGAVYTLVDPNQQVVGGLYYSNDYAAYFRPT